jgi:isochorismate pyruvate lyase
MADVRREIDRIDRELVRLMAERQRYVERAGVIKPVRSAVRDDERVEAVVANVLSEARRQGLSGAIAEPVWRILVERSIARELEVFDARGPGADT